MWRGIFTFSPLFCCCGSCCPCCCCCCCSHCDCVWLWRWFWFLDYAAIQSHLLSHYFNTTTICHTTTKLPQNYYKTTTKLPLQPPLSSLHAFIHSRKGIRLTSDRGRTSTTTQRVSPSFSAGRTVTPVWRSTNLTS